MTVCKNCGNSFEGKFCNQCGQRADLERLDWRFFLHNLEHAVFHIDRGIIYTINQLFRRPGYAIKEYVGGKRVNYMPPLTHLVIISVILFFFTKIFNADGELIFESKQVGTMFDFVTHYKDKVLIVIIIPLTTVYTRLLFPRNGYNFFELFAFHCYMRGQFFIIDMVVLLIDWILVHFVVFLHPYTVYVLSFLPEMIYMGWALSQFMGIADIRKTILRSFLLMLMIIASAFILGGIAGLILFNFSKG